ncbi:MAG: hypothetical protein ACXIUV_12920 [Alkalilacustris sp.]
MRLTLLAVAIILAALGLQLAMVVGVMRPNLPLALLGYAGLFLGMLLLVPAALRRARAPRRGPQGRR